MYVCIVCVCAKITTIYNHGSSKDSVFQKFMKLRDIELTWGGEKTILLFQFSSCSTGYYLSTFFI